MTFSEAYEEEINFPLKSLFNSSKKWKEENRQHVLSFILFFYEFFSCYFCLDDEEDIAYWCKYFNDMPLQTKLNIADEIDESGFEIFRMSENYRRMKL